MPSSGSGGALGESCNGLDDDADGIVDEGCACVPGATQTCFQFDPRFDQVGSCRRGAETCALSGEFGAWGPCEGSIGPAPDACGDGLDDDCDGIDPPCEASGGAAGSSGAGGAAGEAGASGAAGSGNGGDSGATGSGGTSGEVCQNITVLGDCVTVSCPASAPYPKSCQVFFSPGDDRGCVASTPSSPVVYLQAGDQCNAGFITGTLCCTTSQQPALDQQSCPINKPIQYHVTSKAECPAVTD